MPRRSLARSTPGCSWAFGRRWALAALVAYLAFGGDDGFCALPASFARRGLLLAVGIGSEAKAAGLAMDYRKLDQIDPSTRKLVGDVGSEKAQKAIGVITEAKQKMEALQTAYEKDVGVNFRPYLLPIPVMREALDVVYGLLDEESRRDAERVGRLLLSTRYLLNEAPTVKTEPSAARLEIELFRNAVEEQAKFRKEINELIRIMDKFLLFLS
ncbi:unnamed protein product [Effrenium voratum]|nr:unnamed protein product [Effrenium voratum]